MSESKKAVTSDRILAILRDAGTGLRNLQIRTAVFGSGHENMDQAGSDTTEVLQALKKEGKVQLNANKWSLASIKTCPTCDGRGTVAS